jgi:hypothetical protein
VIAPESLLDEGFSLLRKPYTREALVKAMAGAERQEVGKAGAAG